MPNQIHKTAGKNDSRYWLSRIFRPANDRKVASHITSCGRSFVVVALGFSLWTPNREAAARQAAGIYFDILTLGPLNDTETMERRLLRANTVKPTKHRIFSLGIFSYLR
jgi:hypothetical protein